MACCQVSCATAVGEGRPYATRVVAAVDSVATDAINADFVCDGIADEATIREAFLSLAQDLGGGSYLYDGGKVVLLEGNYYCSDAIDLDFTGEPFSAIPPAWFTLEGMGFGTKLNFAAEAAGSNGIDVVAPTQVKGLVLRDFRIFDPGNIGINVDNAQVCTVERVAIVGGQFGIDISNGMLTQVVDCWVEGSADTCIQISGWATIQGCSINVNAANTTIGYSERAINSNGVYSNITGNRIFRSTDNNAAIGWAGVSVAARAQANGPASSTNQIGIRVAGNYSLVAGNVLFGLGNMRPIDAPGGGVVITGNNIHNCEWPARNQPTASPAINASNNGAVVTGNHLQDIDQMGGILVADRSTVSDNVLINVSGHGIVVNGDSNTCSGNRLENVASQGTGGDGITVSGTYNIISGNYVRAQRTADTGSFGIAVTGSRCSVEGNTIDYTKREAIYVTGADNLIANNVTARVAATHIAIPVGAGTRNHLVGNKANYVSAGPGGVNAPRAFLTGALTQVVVGNDATNGPWAIDVTGYNLVGGTIDTFAAGAGPGDNF